MFLRVEIEAEIRVHIDELMREELKNLKLVCANYMYNELLCIYVIHFINPRWVAMYGVLYYSIYVEIGYRERQRERKKREEGEKGQERQKRKERKEKERRKRSNSRQV